ncbi:electron transport complex subunit RsxB [Hydrogenophaga sp. 5NK40-0174]|uniref:electron transport complex subunit RsxB n=1 Tax=Hydrogenophaga sp. 5NK40-0174 TaxID=3127649 RepID=UPI003108E69A
MSEVHSPEKAGSLADRIDAALPQTQCQRCGFADCRAYAEAIASGTTTINRCPPGGAEGVGRLASITGQPATELDPDCGYEGPVTLAVIDEEWCIGCTLCIKACPTDAILGTNKMMHTVMEPYCTGCELCIPVCPVDCISLEPVNASLSGWAGWSEALAQQALERYRDRQTRLGRERAEHEARQTAKAEDKLANLESHSKHTDPATLDRKRAIIEAALKRAKARRSADDH